MEKKLELVQNGKVLSFLLEDSACAGVVKIAQKVAEDVQKVTGLLPQTISRPQGEDVILIATAGKSALLESLFSAGWIDRTLIEGKREVFGIFLLENPLAEMGNTLVICGSDKLGTIYGMFTFSEYIGVSPMCYWGDAEPVRRENVTIGEDISGISKEPSVKYRGFFINDEWPCFGNWTFAHFGGFTAQMYDKVFEFLLRMKGNFLWPAMWTSSFPLDGPGSLNEELADLYGITIAYSHHEPCLRASEEWDKVKGEGTRYGNEWNFYTNKEGLTNYWADALERSGKYQHMVTIGMRGERDSSMLGEQATLQDNIALLKEIITTQRRLIREHIREDVDSVPQLLALYKEVEAYFYGDEQTAGLKEWDELENVIFMLCEDNFGHMRTLPTEEMRAHKGGFGMYYHFDYHGGPVSYEWMPSTKLALTWEQMTQAYDYGVRDVWIVNVGDLKGNEVALQYFLTLAYDFDTWGSSAPNSWQRYLEKWAQKTFPQAGGERWKDIADIYKEFVHLNSMRRPEALHAGIYHPCHFGETDRLLTQLERLEQKNEETYQALTGKTRDALYSMIYYPAKCSINLMRMHLYAGKNAHYAAQGRKVANYYGEKMAQCIREDQRLAAEFAAFRDGKWKGMELERHIGFTKWNDDGWKYPVRMTVFAVDQARMSVSRADEERIAVKNYGAPICIPIHDFLDMACKQAVVEIGNDGEGSLFYTITAQEGEIPNWLELSSLQGEVTDLERIYITCDREKMAQTICDDCKGHGTGCNSLAVQTVSLLVTAGDTTVRLEVKAQNPELQKMPERTFLPSGDVIVMEAHHFSAKKDVPGAAFTHLEEYGRSGNGMKVLPPTMAFTMEMPRPELTYSFLIPRAGAYQIELWSAPVNSLRHRAPLRVALGCNEEQPEPLEVLGADFRAGENSEGRWCQGVLDQIRITKTERTFAEGLQTLTVGALEAGYVLERIVIYPSGRALPKSYLGPTESYFKETEESI